MYVIICTISLYRFIYVFTSIFFSFLDILVIGIDVLGAPQLKSKGVVLMNKQRLNEILDHRQLSEVFYEEKPVWIQEVHGNKATVGFVGSNDTKDLYIKELYEAN